MVYFEILLGVAILLLIFLRILIQALENEAVMARFHRANEKLSQALEDLPYEELGVSEEVKEEVCTLLLSLLLNIFFPFPCSLCLFS